MNRVPPLFGRIVVLCLLLTVSVGGQSSSLLGNLPIVGPLVANLPLVGGLLSGLLNGLLSSDLLGLLSAGDDRPVRAIVRGDVVAIQAAASRDGLPVLKVLDGLVVLASGAERVAGVAERGGRRRDLAGQPGQPDDVGL